MLKKIFNLPNLTLLTALALSTTAAWFAIVGLMTIFPAKATAILIMGGFIEVGKIVATIWLREYWTRSGWQFKAVLMPMVCILMLLTSMGTFGFLSGAHSEQSAVSGDVSAKVSIIDEKIKTQRDNIELARKALQQMDDQVNQRLSRSDNEQGAERAVTIRRQQAPERNRLQKEITDAQSIITKLNEERAPIASQLRKVEAEVGPIKYIAALVYGDNPDSNTLEKAVRWVIILLVIVFDPLAIALVLAGNSSKKWMEEDSKSIKEEVKENMNIPENKNSSTITDLPKIEVHDEFNLEKYPYLFKVPENRHPPGVELAGPQIYKEPVNDASNDTVSDPTINCNKCGTELIDTKSFGSFCPNTECSSRINLPVPEEKDIEPKKSTVDIVNEYLLVKPDSRLSSSGFGNKFPPRAKTGDIFVRVDTVPNKVYKYNGTQWILLDKENTDTYLYNDDYIEFLIQKLESKEYDVEFLTDYEKDQIRAYLKKFQKNYTISDNT